MSRLIYEGPAVIKANQIFRCELTVVVEERIETGGIICISSRHVSDIGHAQNESGNDENYVEFSAGGADVKLEFSRCPGEHPWDKGFSLVVGEGCLDRGDSVSIVLGAGRGFRAQSFSETHCGFRLGIKQSAGADWIVSPKAEAAMFEITGSGAARARAYVKTINSSDANKVLCVKLEDIYGNISKESTVLDVLLDDRRYLGRITIQNGTAHSVGFVVQDDGRWHTLTLASDDGRYFARTNPFGPALIDGMSIYFGDIHAQSGLCDGTNSPDEQYCYARTAAGLDFASVTSHDMELDGNSWELIKEAARNSCVPGEFVTILGYEWSGQHDKGGDNNIYYLSDDGPLVRNWVLRSPWCVTEAEDEYNDLSETIVKIKAATDEFTVIPHFGGRPANFDYFDPGFMRLLEIHSAHRSYEKLWREAVDRKLKLGVAGGSDDHRGAIGDCVVTAREPYYSAHCGLLCVYAGELTRQSIWRAMQERHTYATNGCHMALSFQMNGYIMGDEADLPSGTPMIFRFKAVCHGFFDHAEMYRNNELARSYHGERNQVVEYEGVYEDTVKDGLTIYHVKIVQTDGGVAWSSPIFVQGTGD